MKRYKVYFEIYGKKMVTSVIDASETQAKEQVKRSIKFHKITVEPLTPDEDELTQKLKDLFKF
jgi:hypothetical protein